MKTPMTNNKKIKSKISSVKQSDEYRGTSRYEFGSDYDYQDTDSYEQPYRNSQKGYAPIDLESESSTTSEPNKVLNKNQR